MQRGWKTKYRWGDANCRADPRAGSGRGPTAGTARRRRLADDPVVAALISEGEPAVEPLIDCMENDKRLTRSVHFGRDFSGYCLIIGVREAAYVAISAILQKSFFGPARRPTI